jgi:hypothetical protein
MDGMKPRPQGVIIWDLEGQEFYQWFSYVGDPNNLSKLAPELDAVADKMFSRLRDAGYRVGMTLRPSTFQTGTTLPITCNASPNAHDVGLGIADVFIKLDAPWPYRGYACAAPNLWAQPGAHQPSFQHRIDDDMTIFDILEAKVAYATERWGATIFYIDSTVYTKGASVNANIFRRLQKRFPRVLFIPEQKLIGTWGVTAPYGDGRNGEFDTPAHVKKVYPEAFSVLMAYNGVNFSGPAYGRLVQSVREGDILLVQAGWNDPNNAVIARIYRDAGYAN